MCCSLLSIGSRFSAPFSTFLFNRKSSPEFSLLIQILNFKIILKRFPNQVIWCPLDICSTFTWSPLQTFTEFFAILFIDRTRRNMGRSKRRASRSTARSRMANLPALRIGCPGTQIKVFVQSFRICWFTVYDRFIVHNRFTVYKCVGAVKCIFVSNENPTNLRLLVSQPNATREIAIFQDAFLSPYGRWSDRPNSLW